MVLVSVSCAQVLSCPVKSLRDRLNHPEDRNIVLKHIIGRKVRTTYNDRNGIKKTFFVSGISTQAAASLPAYGHLRQPFNVNVAAHFYVRHRINLHFPYAPCITERFSGGGEDRHYPMELLELVDDNNEGKDNERWLGRLFREIGENDQQSANSSSSSSSSRQTLCLPNDEEIGENSGRNEFSQNARRIFW